MGTAGAENTQHYQKGKGQMIPILKLLKCLAYVFVTSVVVMVLGLFYGLIPIAILDAKSLIPAL